MSILIKGMNMPKPDKNELETIMCLVLSSSGLVELIDPDTNTLLEEYRAIEVFTPHGRLIDADILNDSISKQIEPFQALEKYEGDDNPSIATAIDLGASLCQHELELVPTVIEAEEG